MPSARPQLVERPEVRDGEGSVAQPSSANYLYVVPSGTIVPPVGLARSPGILSRQEVARRREDNERKRLAKMAAVPDVMGPAAVEMDAGDVTPIPKNKGGRPRKEP